MWFVEESSRQVDWTEVPKDIGGNVEVDTWHELCQNANGSELPDIKTEDVKPVTMFWFWANTGAVGGSVKYTQKVSNIRRLSGFPSRLEWLLTTS